MIVYLFFLGLAFFLFLFCLYTMGKDDVVFIRKNVTLEDQFSIAFVVAIIVLLFSRIFYVAFHFDPTYLNPLVFFLFPYFPGLSLIGGVVGGILFLLYSTKRKKMPVLRITDFFAVSFFGSLPLGYVGIFFLTRILNPFLHLFLPAIYFSLFVFFYALLYKKLIRNELKNGTITVLMFIIFSFITFMVSMLSDSKRLGFVLFPEDYLSVLVFVASLLILFKQELYVPKVRGREK